MKFSIALVTAVLATSALAAPLTEKRQTRANGRMIDRRTNPPQNKHKGKHNEEYSSNWAGAVLIGSGYTGVSAQFNAPTPQMPPGKPISPIFGSLG